MRDQQVHSQAWPTTKPFWDGFTHVHGLYWGLGPRHPKLPTGWRAGTAIRQLQCLIQCGKHKKAGGDLVLCWTIVSPLTIYDGWASHECSAGSCLPFPTVNCTQNAKGLISIASCLLHIPVPFRVPGSLSKWEQYLHQSFQNLLCKAMTTYHWSFRFISNSLMM